MTQENANRFNRREFVKTASVLGAGVWLGAPAWAGTRRRWINEKVNFACIGVGGKGWSDMNDAGRLGNVVAICDIDENNLNRAAERYPDAKRFVDFREMLETFADSFDAVTVSTPDHTHAPATVRAMKLGKHCFCQKPMTQHIREARLVADLARERNLATQMGNQGTANNTLRKAAAILKSGALGDVSEAHIWTNRPVWPQGVDRPDWTDPVPDHVHWDLWIGPAPKRPYAVWKEKRGWGGKEAYHPFNWRGWWDFGTGALGDMACHTLNMPFMGLDLRDPVSVEAETSGHNRDSYPSWSKIRYEFPARGDRGALTMYWYDGGKKPDVSLLERSAAAPQQTPSELAGSGAIIVGERATLYSPSDYGGEYTIFGDVEEPDVEFEKSPGHFEELIRAIETGQPAKSNFPEYAGPLTETVLLGNLAVWAQRKVNWNAESMTPTNAPELAGMVRGDYRDGWAL